MKTIWSYILLIVFLTVCAIQYNSESTSSPTILLLGSVIFFPIVLQVSLYLITKNIHKAFYLTLLCVLLNILFYDYFYVQIFDEKGNAILQFFLCVSLAVSSFINLILSIFYIKQRFKERSFRKIRKIAFLKIYLPLVWMLIIFIILSILYGKYINGLMEFLKT